MAWYNSGTWTDLPIDTGLPNIMAQVCCAISERYTILNATPPAWSVVGGTATNPVANDFDGARIDDVLILTNIEQAQDAIETLVTAGVGDGRFLHPDTPGAALITLSDLLGRGSYGATWLIPVHASDIRAWIQIKDALDELTQPCWEMEILYDAGTYQNDPARPPTWAGTVAATPVSYSGGHEQWAVDFIRHGGLNKLKTAHISGTLVAGWWVGVNQRINSSLVAMSVDVDGVTYTSLLTAGSTPLYRSETATWPSLVSNPLLFDNVTPPPVVQPTIGGGIQRIQYDYFWAKESAFVVGNRCVTDISAGLTYG